MRTLICIATTALPLVALLLTSPGCQTKRNTATGGIVEMPDQPQPIAVVNRVRAPAGPGLNQNDPDPCLTRLQDLITPLYEYYIKYGCLPGNLEDLHSVADITQELNFTCPVSGKPYIYNPVGLAPPGGGTLNLVLYDATPVHNGRRRGVVAGPALNGNNQLFFQMFAVDLSEQVFQRYTPVPPPSTQPASRADPSVGSAGRAATPVPPDRPAR